MSDDIAARLQLWSTQHVGHDEPDAHDAFQSLVKEVQHLERMREAAEQRAEHLRDMVERAGTDNRARALRECLEQASHNCSYDVAKWARRELVNMGHAEYAGDVS